MRFSSSQQNRSAISGRQDAEFEQLKKERDELLARERAARAEAEAAQREVTAILESITDAFTALDREWRYTYINKAAGEIIHAAGRDPDDLLGKVVWEEFPEFAGTKFQTELLQAAREGEVVEFDEYYPPLDAWFHLRVCPSEQGVFVYFEDVTERRRTEEALRETETKLTGLYTSDVIGVAWGEEELVLEANDVLLDMLGYTREDLLDGGLNWNEMTPPDEREQSAQAIQEAIETGRFAPFEKNFIRKDGSRVPTIIGGHCLSTDPFRYVSFILDISEQKRAEERLRTSEERYKALYEDNPFMYFTVDTRGTVLSVNRSGAEQLGYTVEELVGRQVLDLFHEEDKEGVSRYFSTCLQDLERPSSWEARKLRKDGSTLWAKENVRLVRSTDGGTVVLLICEDITERNQAEEQVLLQAQLLEQVQAAVISTDLQGTVTHWNEYAEELYGWSREEALGRNIVGLTIGTAKAGVAEEIMDRLRAGETWEGEFVVRRKDGSTFPAHVTDSLIYNAQGRAVGIVGVSTDITERKQAEKERERLLAREWTARAEAAVRRRISRELHDRVAHSIGVIHQSLELYEAFKEHDPSQAGAKMQLARETTREALELTRNLSRELYDTEAKGGLSAALSNLLETAVPPGLESNISVEGDESLIPPHVREQLFLTLREAVRNAVSHSGADHLRIRVEVYPERVVARVEDDGRGFEQASEGDRSGRGIHSMRERAELVGGTFRLSSTPGAGTKIEASIPLDGGSERRMEPLDDFSNGGR
jgi:PAS domain S-box-containing protein